MCAKVQIMGVNWKLNSGFLKFILFNKVIEISELALIMNCSSLTSKS